MKNCILIVFVLFCFNLDAQISANGLLAYYPFDGDVLDYSSNGYNGVMRGGSFSSDQDGNQNSAIRLNGFNDFVDLSAFAIPYRENLGEISIFFYVKFDQTTNNQTILSLGNSGENLQTNVFEIEYENNRFQIESETGSASFNTELQIDDRTFLFDNQWHQILITIDENKLTYCRDEEVIFSGNYTPAETLTSSLFLGCFGGGNAAECCHFGGSIDELQFYDRILSKRQLTSTQDAFLSSQNVKYFPNPTNSGVHIDLGEIYNSLQVDITGVDGKLISRKEFDGIQEFDIDLPSTSGIYFLHISNQETNQRFKSLRIVKQ